MKIFAISDEFPVLSDGTAGVTAVNVIIHALLSELKNQGHEVTLQTVFHASHGTSLSAEQKLLWEDAKRHFVLQEPILLASHFTGTAKRFRSLRMLFSPRMALHHYYPAMHVRKFLKERIDSYSPDVILTLWSMQAIAATHLSKVPRVAFHGDIDYLPRCVRGLDQKGVFSTPRSLFTRIDLYLRCRLFAKAHHKLMRAVDSIANVTAWNAAYYENKGHPHSIYIRNTWIDAGVLSTPQRGDQPLRIIGHIGEVSRTGSTYGLHFLLSDVMPILERKMNGRPFEVHIIGGGKPSPVLQELLSRPHVVSRGFVADLAPEFAKCDAFCILNNVGPFIAAYTRHIVAWSHGVPLIAHRRSKEAIPEIIDGSNALLGDTAEEVADAIITAVTNQKLNQHLRGDGRATFVRHFTPAVVAGKVNAELQWAVSGSKVLEA